MTLGSSVPVRRRQLYRMSIGIAKRETTSGSLALATIPARSVSGKNEGVWYCMRWVILPVAVGHDRVISKLAARPTAGPGGRWHAHGRQPLSWADDRS